MHHFTVSNFNFSISSMRDPHQVKIKGAYPTMTVTKKIVDFDELHEDKTFSSETTSMAKGQ